MTNTGDCYHIDNVIIKILKKCNKKSDQSTGFQIIVKVCSINENKDQEKEKKDYKNKRMIHHNNESNPMK